MNRIIATIQNIFILWLELIDKFSYLKTDITILDQGVITATGECGDFFKFAIQWIRDSRWVIDVSESLTTV